MSFAVVTGYGGCVLALNSTLNECSREYSRVNLPLLHVPPRTFWPVLKTIIYTILEQSSDKKGDSAGMQVSISRNSLKGTRIVIPCKQI
jgi:hypothetical protein